MPAGNGTNLQGLQFNTAQGAFLGGYLAAAYSKTGVVGDLWRVEDRAGDHLHGRLLEGVQYYNQQNDKNVKVLGWNEKNQKAGTFASSFTDQQQGQADQPDVPAAGRDIVFPVAGGTGVGSAAAAQASNGQLDVIWVDTDGCVGVPQYCKYFLTSVTKNLTGSVQQYVEQAATGTFPTGNYIGTLENNGTGLAPFHDFDSKVRRPEGQLDAGQGRHHLRQDQRSPRRSQPQ